MGNKKYLFGITPETDLERQIVTSDVFREGMTWGKPRNGHPEGKVGIHVAGILNWIDACPWQGDRRDLRLVTLLHDIGKYKVKYSQNGHLVGDPHAVFSGQIARQFTEDSRILGVIKYHSKPFSFYRKERDKNRFDEEKFIGTFSSLDLDLLTKFNYADLFERDNAPAYWFENKCLELGLIYRRASEDLGERKDVRSGS